LLEATKQLAENRAHGNDTRLLINLTANVLHDETLLSWLGVALKAAALPPSALILQLREIDVINNMPAAKAFADGIRQLGCRFSIGGFGRVMDSLTTLKSVPVDIVQVDASFTRNLLANNDTQPLKTLVAEVGAQSAAVVIPFVENASVLATLWQVGADFIQGHYLQAPSRSMNYEFTDIA
jgi:EAL domain-containing protein (putative c-di-GMP-specific phosphodiesterase class I)